MLRIFSKLAIVGAALVIIAGLTVLISGQPGSKLTRRPASKHHVGMVDDWSHHHLVFSNPGAYEQAVKNAAALAKWFTIRYDDRYILQDSKRTATSNLAAAVANGAAMQAPHMIGPLRRIPQGIHPRMQGDWSVSLNGGSVATAVFPPKYTFDVNGTPSCTGDFAIYPVDIAGSSTQANLVGFSNLYSASSGTGFCSGSGPTVKFAYDIGTGVVQTSPVLSLDGTQVAYVESISGGSKFHVLTIGTNGSPGEGASASSPCAPGNKTSPCNSNASDTAITMSGSASVTRSMPFVDYGNNIAYVGDDSGHLHQFTGVFSGSPAESGAPWPVSVDPTGALLSGPVYDSVSGLVFVAGSDGNLYGVGTGFSGTTAGVIRGAVISGHSTTGAGVCSGIADPPLVDSSNGTIFTQVNYSGSAANCTGDALLVQLDTTAPAVAATWAASHSYTFGNLITDGTTNCAGGPCIQWCADSGKSGGSTPAWSTAVGGVTTDGTSGTYAVWVNVGAQQLDLRASIPQATFSAADAVHVGAFDNTYLSSGGSSGNYYYTLSGVVTLRRATFSGSPSTMAAGTGSLTIGDGTSGLPSPFTEIYNPNGASAKDWLFLGISLSGIAVGGCAVADACILSFNITSGFPGAAAQGAIESGGTSGITIDNVFSESLWQAAYGYSLDTLITDSNGNVEEVTACAGTCTSGGSAPTWNPSPPGISTTLSAPGITSTSQTVINVGSTAGLLVGYYIKIDSEVLGISNVNSSTVLTVTRGQAGTVAADHSTGAAINTYTTTIDNPGANQVTWTNQGPNQTSSAYFGTLTGKTAVKLTQAGLK